MATDSEHFKKTKSRVKPEKGGKGGRSRINRNLALRLFEAGEFTYPQIAKHLNCSERQVARMYKEFVDAEKLEDTRNKKEPDIVALDFDEECMRAQSISFEKWLHNKMQPKGARRIFNFCKNVWYEIWDRPSLIRASDRDDPLSDQLAQQFLTEFKEDKARIRERKKLIRQLFTFLDREGINKKHLTMKDTTDPRPVKRIPELELPDFPLGFVDALTEIEREHGRVVCTLIMFKLCTQMRTGDRKAETELFGLQYGHGTSYVLLQGDIVRGSVLAKRSERWGLSWLPREVRERVKELGLTRGENVVSVSKRKLRKIWKTASNKHIGVAMDLHDLRKVSLTWFYVMGIRLEVAVNINVGWLDLSTAVKHYAHFGALMKRSEKEAYRKNIPEWFKEGLDEYLTDEGIRRILQPGVGARYG